MRVEGENHRTGKEGVEKLMWIKEENIQAKVPLSLLRIDKKTY